MNGAHHYASVTTASPQTPAPSAAGVPQVAQTQDSHKSLSAGESAAPEERRRRPGYNRPYYPQRPQRPYRPYRPYNRPGGYPSRYPYRPYLREQLVDPEFEPYDDPAYRKSSSLGYVLDAFVRVLTRILSKPAKHSKKGSPTTNGTTSTGPGTDVTSTGPPPVSNGDDSSLTATPPQSPPPDESFFYSVGDVSGPFKFMVALAEVPSGLHAPGNPHLNKLPWGAQRPAPKPGSGYVGVIEDEDLDTPATAEEGAEELPEEVNDDVATPETHPPVYF